MRLGRAHRLIFLAIAGGCVHPDALSASEHRAAATDEDREARKEQHEYVPEARAVALETPGLRPSDKEAADPDLHPPYNPTSGYLRAAETHLRLAHGHTEAALQLERFEDEACSTLAPPARAACPLVSGAVQTVEESRWGVRLHLKPGSNGAELIAEMRCHLAFARTHGFQGLPECPLYYRSAGVDLVGLGEVIEVRATEEAAAFAIRRDAREIFAAPSAP